MSTRIIPSLLDTLIKRLEGPETQELEFKSARVDLPKDLWPSVSAFANTRGGWVILGVREQDGVMKVDGVGNANLQLQNLQNMLRNPQKISFPICGADDVSLEVLDQKDLIVLRVPEAPRKARPVYVNGNPYTGTYVRRNAGDYHCTKPEVDRMMREASDIAADSTILPYFDWEDIDPEALSRYRRRFQTLNPGSLWNGHKDQRFLQAIGGFRRDRENNKQGLTVAGLLLLGKPEALREWRSRHLIDFRLVSTDDMSDVRWDNRIAWEGNIFDAFEAIYPSLVAHQPVPFRLKGATRLNESHVHVALREALVNLLVHADYAETQASLIKRSPGGYFFRNPGSSRVPEGDLFTGDRSDPRNPILVSMFRFIGLSEEAGTGIPKIIKAWRELGFHLPEIDAGTERYEFSLGLRHAHMLSDEDRSWLSSMGNDWAEAEQLALVIAKHEGAVDNLKLRTLTGMHSADVTKVLGSLKNRRLLKPKGIGRQTRYHLGPRALGDLGPLFSGFAASTPMRVSLEGKPASFEDSTSSLEGIPITSQPVWKELTGIAKVAQLSRRLSPTIRDSIIVQLCEVCPLSIHDLAELIQRSEAHIREAVRSLMALNRITYLFPEQPSHPQQKYVAYKPEKKVKSRS